MWYPDTSPAIFRPNNYPYERTRSQPIQSSVPHRGSDNRLYFHADIAFVYGIYLWRHASPQPVATLPLGVRLNVCAFGTNRRLLDPQ